MITNILMGCVIALCVANAIIQNDKAKIGWIVACLGWFLALLNRII